MRAQTKAKVEEAMQEEDRPQPKRPKVHAQTVVREKPAAKSTGPLGNARPRAKVRRAAAPESPHVRASVASVATFASVATLPELTHACARTGSRATGADRV